MTEQALIEAPQVEAEAPQKGEFLIVIEGKRMSKGRLPKVMIECLKRADGGPLPLVKLAQRVKGTKVGKEATVKDVKTRVRQIADWFVKNTDYVKRTDEGYVLTRAGE